MFEGIQNKLPGRSPESAIEQHGDELAMGVQQMGGGLKDVSTLRVVSDHEALGRHDLERLEDGRVAGLAADVDRLVHLADRARAAIPEHAQNGQLGSSRPRKGFLCSWHGEPSVRDGRSGYEAV